MPSDELAELLDRRDASLDDAARAEIDRCIERRFGVRRAVLVSDMAGFSKQTRRHGICHVLATIRRMQRLCLPIIASHEGHLVKTVGDNLFATFPSADLAMRAAMAMMQCCAEDSATRPLDENVQVDIGIDFGDFLDIDGADFWGDPVNLAAKLGEDIADGGEVLLTRRAADTVRVPEGWTLVPRSIAISGVALEYVALEPERAGSPVT
jgi:adenylate cyclase